MARSECVPALAASNLRQITGHLAANARLRPERGLRVVTKGRQPENDRVHESRESRRSFRNVGPGQHVLVRAKKRI
jgi:hypothetical protein